MIIDDLTLIQPIARGAFGNVYLAKKENSKNRFAVKEIAREYLKNKKIKNYLNNHVQFLTKIDNPKILKLIGIKETKMYYYLILEYCNGGTLSDCLDYYTEKNNEKPFSEEIVQYLMKQIVSAIYYLHQKNIVHRNLKLDNILINFDSEEDRKNRNMLKAKIKIKDFAFARHIKPIEDIYKIPLSFDLNNLREFYIKSDFTYYDQKVDIWNLGIMCYEMLMNKSLIFYDKVYYNLPLDFSLELVYFLNAMLQKNIKDRKNIEDLCDDEFLQKPFKELTKFKPKNEYEKRFTYFHFDVTNLFFEDDILYPPFLVRNLKNNNKKRFTDEHSIDLDSEKKIKIKLKNYSK